MPIYEYKCDKCGHNFDVRRDVTGEEKEPKCPECGAEKPNRVFTAFNACGGCAPAQEWIPRGGG
jgi:putative FmdB family regulatory protein